MAKEMKVDIVNRETILPSSQTPQNLKTYKLSLMDQLAPAFYTPLILFYPSNNDHEDIQEKYLQKLKKSLSETLVLFYPFAGRIKNQVFIDCNDEGVEFLEAQANFKISEIMDHPDAANLQQFLPKEIMSTEAATGCLLLVQATVFECGGLSIGVSMSHKLSDVSTLSTFMKCWGGKALCSSHVVVPELSAASIFPPMDISASPQNPNFEILKCLTKRFVFNDSTIASLKAKSASPSVQNPTRVEVVSALIWKCALKAARSNSKSLKPSIVFLPVNIRRRVMPPISEHCVGNLSVILQTKTTEKNLDLQSLLVQIRRGKEGFVEKCSKTLRGEEALPTIQEVAFTGTHNPETSQNVENYFITSWCKFGLYDVDFGWGKPAWMSLTSLPRKNTIVLVDTSDGRGIEAWVTLREEDMALFERDEELIEFTS